MDNNPTVGNVDGKQDEDLPVFTDSNTELLKSEVIASLKEVPGYEALARQMKKTPVTFKNLKRPAKVSETGKVLVKAYRVPCLVLSKSAGLLSPGAQLNIGITIGTRNLAVLVMAA